MAEAIRRDCDPLLFSLGYRNPRKNDLNRLGGITRRNMYLRWRGTTLDSVGFYWDKYNRAKCYMEFETSTVVSRPEEGRPAVRRITRGSMVAWKGPGRYIGSGWFGPWRSIDSFTAQLRRRILQLEGYFQTGERGWWINVGNTQCIGPEDGDSFPIEGIKLWGDPWLDPESDYDPASAPEETPPRSPQTPVPL